MRAMIRKIALAVLLFGPGMGHTIPVPVLDIPSLAQESDLIVVGNVESTRDGGSASVDSGERRIPARLILGEMEVDEVLKGTTDSPTISFRCLLPDEFIGYRSVVNGYQMLFLKRSDTGYTLTSPYNPSLPALSGARADAGDVLSKIVFHLGAVLESESTPLGQRHGSLFALNTIRNSESTAVLHRALRENDDDLRLNAAGFLLQRNDISGLEIAESALMNPAVVPSNLIHNLDYAIGQGVKDEKAVPILGRLAGSQDVETRQAAASALRHTGSRSALKPLATMLDDSDFQVRYEVILGLAQITGDRGWVPNMDRFRSEEGKYLQHWHNWMSTN